MGNDSSKRAKSSLQPIRRVGIDDVAPAQEAAEKKAQTPRPITTLSSGREITQTNVCEIFQQMVNDRATAEVESAAKGKLKKKDKEKIKLDYDRTLKYLCEELVFILKDKERREELLQLTPEAFEEVVKSDDLVVPDESFVLLTVGAWAERRANSDVMKEHNLLSPPKVDLRGSDGLFKSLGEGAAKLLEPADKGSSEMAATEDDQKKEGGDDLPEENKKPGDTSGDADAQPKKGDDDASKQKKEEKEEGEEEGKKKEASGQAEEELPVNLRGTAGLYATFAGAYLNMISDEEMARKLQEEEEEEAKVRRKLMEEEDEKLARALQEGEMADGGTLPGGPSLSAGQDDQEEEEDLEPIPEYKLTPEYIDRIKKYMQPFIQYIRFSMLPLNILNTLANEHLIPNQYLTEAYKYHMLMGSNLPDLLDKKNPRYKRRRYVCSVEWDRQWHGQHIQISADGKVATKTQSSWYSLACASEGFQHGKHFWAIKVDGDETYIGVTQKGNSSLDNYLGGNQHSWAFRTSYKYSYSHGNGYYGEPFGRGDVIGVLLDMDAGSLTFYKNGKDLGVCFTNLPRSEKLYPAVGWRAGHMTLVDPSSSNYPPDFLNRLMS